LVIGQRLIYDDAGIDLQDPAATLLPAQELPDG